MFNYHDRLTSRVAPTGELELDLPKPYASTMDVDSSPVGEV